MIYNKNIILEVLIMPRYKLSPIERAAEKERKVIENDAAVIIYSHGALSAAGAYK